MFDKLEKRQAEVNEMLGKAGSPLVKIRRALDLLTPPHPMPGEAKVIREALEAINELQRGTKAPAEKQDKYYAVTGRISGDDEDSHMVFTAKNTMQAVQMFKDWMHESRREDPENDGDLTAEDSEEEKECYVNMVFSSTEKIDFDPAHRLFPSDTDRQRIIESER